MAQGNGNQRSRGSAVPPAQDSSPVESSAASAGNVSAEVPAKTTSAKTTSDKTTSDNTGAGKTAAAKIVPEAPVPDDDVVGKAYDGRLMRRLIRYLAPYKLQVALSFAAILINAVAGVLGPYLTKVAVDTYFTPAAHSAHAGTPHLSWLARRLDPNPLTGVTEIALLYLGTLVVIFALEFVQTYLMQWTGQKIMFDLRSQIFRHIQSMHVGFFDKNPVGRLVTRVTSDVDALNEMFTSGVLAIFEDVFALLFIVIIMLRMSWPLALLTLSVIPGILYATQLFRRHVRDSYRRQRSATAKINSFTAEYVNGMSVVQLFNREHRALDDFSAVNSENKQAWTDAIFAYALYYPVVELLSSIAIALVIWRGGVAVLHGTPALASAATWFRPAVTVGILIAFIQYAQRFFRPIMDLSDKYNILQAAMAAAERVFKLVDTPPEISSPADPTQPNPRSPARGRIEFREVWFTYGNLTPGQWSDLSALSARSVADAPASAPANDHSPSHPRQEARQDARQDSRQDPRQDPSIEWILRGVSFTIEPDATAAIVGHTGAGKTTLTALMMRFYDVQAGEVLVDGVDVRDQDLAQLRRRFGVVLQDPFLFSGTVGANIRLGTETITDAEVAHAADEVNVGDFIRSLPGAFAEPVLERGSTLSTGQKQLISFARALAHRPGILILDEATSSVDTETELRVRSALDRMISGRTSVLIAHRLSTVQRADTILVMHKGKLREQGSHQELLALRGLYYKLYQLQYKDQELGTPLADRLTA